MRRHKTSNEHRDRERIVELTSVSTVFSAEALLAELQTNGIKAMLSADDVGGMRPAVGFAAGYRVMVFEHDLEEAKALIAGVDG